MLSSIPRSIWPAAGSQILHRVRLRMTSERVSMFPFRRGIFDTASAVMVG
jgi:hypothetical protein